MYSKLNDTLMSEENKKQFAEMNTKYETEKKDNEISLLNKDKDLREYWMKNWSMLNTNKAIAATRNWQQKNWKKPEQRKPKVSIQ